MSATSIPVVLREAAVDSPTFRANVLHFSDQVDVVERWLDGYAKSATRLAHDVKALDETITSYLTKITPPPAADGLIDHDHTAVALRTYSDGAREWWSHVAGSARHAESMVVEPIRAFLANDLRTFQAARRALDVAQKTYDTIMARYAGQSRTREPSAQREDAFALFEARKAYLKAAMEFCVFGPQLRATLDKLLVHLSCDLFADMSRRIRVAAATAASHSAASDMDRVRGWVRDLESFDSVFRRELLLARKDVADAATEAFKPSRELDDYSSAMATALDNRGPGGATEQDSGLAAVEKQGWLFYKQSAGKPTRTTWIRRWYYCRNGVLGWLVQGPQGGVVQGEELGILLCNVKPTTQEDRRFCFEVKTKMHNILLQADSQTQLVEWIRVFELAKTRTLEASLSRDKSNLPQGADPAFSITQPPAPEFSAKLVDGIDDQTGSSDRATAALPSTGAADQSSGMRGNMDLGSGLSRRALTNLVLDTGESRTEQAARMLQKLDLHRKPVNQMPGDVISIPSPGMPGSATSGNTPLPSASSAQPPPQPISVRGLPPLATNAPAKGGLLAPLTLAKPPAPTSLSRSVMTIGATSQSQDTLGVATKIPTVFLANYWGCRSSNTRVTLVTKDLRSGDDAFPPHYPFELRSHDVQFRVLFPGVSSKEKLVLVFRASWDSCFKSGISDPTLVGTGRIFVTSDNMYFYGQQIGLVISYRLRLDSISEVVAESLEHGDVICLNLMGSEPHSKINIKTFLEDAQLLHARINLLVDDLQSEEPMNLTELINALLSLERDDTMRKSPSEESWEQVSVYTPIDDGTTTGKSVVPLGRAVATHGSTGKHASTMTRRAVAVPKFQLPTKPVLYEPDDMPPVVAERHFEISAKACFHVLFGDRSFVFPMLYFEKRARQISQGPWISMEADSNVTGSKMAREFRFKADTLDMLGRARLEDVLDTQQIDIFTDHVMYMVTHTKTPWHLPHSHDLRIVTRIVITHVAKSKCRLAIYTRANWSRQPATVFARNLVQKQALADADRDADNLAELATDQVRRLGPHSRTNRAIHVYGQIGQLTKPVEFRPSENTSDSDVGGTGTGTGTGIGSGTTVEPRTLTAMVFETVRSLAESVASSLVMWVVAGLKHVLKAVTAQRVLLLLLLGSVVANVAGGWIGGSRWWQERGAMSYMRELGVGPHKRMSRAIFLHDLDGAAAVGMEGSGGYKTENSTCYSIFRTITQLQDLDASVSSSSSSSSTPSLVPSQLIGSSTSKATIARLRRTRQKLGGYRHDLLVAMRVVNALERDMVHAEWLNWLQSETFMCDRTEKMLMAVGGSGDAAGGGVAENRSDGTGGGAEQRVLTKEEEAKLEALRDWHQRHCGSCRLEQMAVDEKASLSYV